MDINKDLLAPCGLYCGVCGVYIATKDNNTRFKELLLDMYQRSMSGLDQCTIRDVECEGCLSDRKSIFCSYCTIRNCVAEKGYEGCHQCAEFPCNYIDTFPIPVGKKVILRAIPYWREQGTEKWAHDEEARYVCPTCGNHLFRGAKRCNKCKTSVDLD
ncbi:MAG: DUF3795 domain-containing protein [Deltaproteobacteria bacterium]|nr:DUF3795 domain-containing protein [Deltaproteobacteria bacterium]